ncbi:HGL156Cp [Eremothecium sinecaudum]|uniref:HGL156Cp n=1 Tax=Eremothecium sinecaudum TaxID=45286 RepID=A0A0X8HVB2_9SACH|nr:HGL156Cp [Eremothecium sinecaudum]AMD22184.1 HGL156Cp [Eremothecium sinecaudum]
MKPRASNKSDQKDRIGNEDVRNAAQNPFLDNNAWNEGNYNPPPIGSSDIDRVAESDYRGYYSRHQQGAAQSSRTGPQVPQQNSGISAGQIVPPSRHPKRQQPQHSGRSMTSMPGVAYDRYPVSSRVTSMVGMSQALGINGGERHGAHHGQGTASGSSGSEDVSMLSLESSNPFIGDHDFSPFGGYPASSFPLLLSEKEDDDYLHNPDPEEEARLDKRRFLLDFKHMDHRSAGGLAGLCAMFLGAIVVFIVIPVLTYTGAVDHGKANLAELLTEYEYPQLSAIRMALVDPDTPANANKWKALDGSDWELVFSDEFNAIGRTFYDGDDQFWTAADMHYDATKDLEWYSPDAATTTDGVLKLRLDAYKTHDLYYRSGMLQSWNKLCFTQGAIEISANLPGYGIFQGVWPGLWTLGNLARPGYLASAEGVWPYSYESCDAGITPNQSSTDGISYLPGQRLSACTCDGEDHPNQGVGRGAPEIDILEGTVDAKLGIGVVSQSLQVAPFDVWYIPDYEFIEIYNISITQMNTYCGGPFQQAVSAVSTLNPDWYEFGPTAGLYQSYAFEYLNDKDNGYISWLVGRERTHTMYSTALHPNGNVDWRPISKEPMSIIMNLGFSTNWVYIDWTHLYFPMVMSVDYVRIYQPPGAKSITCDPPDHPTYQYIQDHLNAYTNANLTSWADAGYTFPKNILTGKCVSSKFKKNN